MLFAPTVTHPRHRFRNHSHPAFVEEAKIDRPIVNPLEQMRDYDFVMGFHDVLVSVGALLQDVFSGMSSNGGVVAGFSVSATSPASLNITLGPGRVYTMAYPDPTAVGSIPQDIGTQFCMQGINNGQTLTFTPPPAGQSQWNLIQVQFSPNDVVRPGDPNGGNVPFYNSTNPTIPNMASIATVRQHRAVIQVIQGIAAATGSETPPSPSANWVPLYLIDLAGGQASISINQVIPCAPGVGTNVPNNYPYAPFLAGFQASHHNGRPGQAPKINLASEVTGILPATNLPPNLLTGSFPTVRTLLTGNLTLYVSPTGSDSSNGLTQAAAFATIQGALNKVYSSYDLAGYTVTINVAAGTYGGASLSGAPVGAPAYGSPIFITGVGPSTIISVINNSCVAASGGASVTVSNFYLTATGNLTNGTGNGLAAVNGGQIAIGAGLTFGVCGGAHLIANAGNMTAPSGTAYTVSGGAAAHLCASAPGTLTTIGTNVTITGTPNFSTGFAYALQNGTIFCWSSTYSGSATGPRYNASVNGIINTQGGGQTYLPGNSTGTVASGGIYE